MADDEAMAHELALLRSDYESLLEQYNASERNIRDLIQRHEEIVNHLADVCRRNDQMQASGDRLRDLLLEFDVLYDDRIDHAIAHWGGTNV